jgi:hypothetical protein
MELHDQFFEIAFDAIAREDADLRVLFELNQGKYDDRHHGVGFLFETTYVYLVYKHLLSEKFPAKVIWECKYPSIRSQHADLGLMIDGPLTSLIEFKLLTKERKSYEEIVRDIKRLHAEQKAGNKWLFVLSFRGNKKENLEYLISRNPTLKLLRDATITSKWYDSKQCQHKLLNVDFLFFELS